MDKRRDHTGFGILEMTTSCHHFNIIITLNSYKPAPIGATMTDCDPYSQALQYLEEHHIVPLFHNLTANIVYHQPKDPVQYIIELVCEMWIVIGLNGI